VNGGVLVALDYSGTLSLGALLFGGDEALLEALATSGLRELGIDRPETFWKEIVEPTWEAASTTPCGYGHVLSEQVRALLAARGLRPPADLRARADAFVARYLAQSAIDPAWKPLLSELAERPQVTAIIATDHYAEATGHIVGQLEALGIAAGPALGGSGRVLVANSADLGAHKADRAFWERLRPVATKKGHPRSIVVVDDFGANEAAPDAYGDPLRVERRVRATVETLAAVFGAPVESFRFCLPGRRPDGPTYQSLVRQASEFVRQAVGQ